ncbi:MAG: AraC family transcriptional regulator [Pseudomonadota bacterium]
MSFHPRMYANVSGFEPVSAVQCLLLDRMVVDYWHVRVPTQARGRYVSMHPRFVFLLDGKRITLCHGDMAHPVECAACFIPAGLEVRSSLMHSTQLRHVDIHVSLNQLKSLVGGSDTVKRPVFLRDAVRVETLAATLAQECESKSRNSAHSIVLSEALILEFFHLAGSPARPHSADALSLAALRSYVMANLQGRIAVSDLARASNMSRSHFNRIFRAETQQSPYQWVLSLRVEHAKELVREGHSFAEAADASGFADQAHFNRVFKSVTGLVPSFWMNEHADPCDGRKLQDEAGG